MKRSIFLWLLIAGCLALNAQINKFKRNESTRLETKQEPKTKSQSTAKTEEYALYRDITHRYSWIVGVGEPITQEVANHLPFYFKLSKKNAKGHWQHIQAMHGNSLTIEHQKGTYILNPQYDTNEEMKEWRDKLAGVCQWYITPDLSGDIVAEERAYDEEGYMVYGFVPVRIKPNTAVGSYINDYGYPIDIAPNDKYTYGNVVSITYDSRGYDAIVNYLDGAGYRRFNNDGVDQRQFEYDEQGRVTKILSCNAVGDRIIDNWGNCGHTYVYNDTLHTKLTTCVNADLQPMRMLDTRADLLSTFVCCEDTFDEWGRRCERRFFDENHQPDTTHNGIHRIVYSYSDNGDLLSTQYYDINNNPVNL